MSTSTPSRRRNTWPGAAMQANGLPVGYIEFEGEGHGFRPAENIVRSLEAELWSYGSVLGFEPADDIEPVEIR